MKTLTRFGLPYFHHILFSITFDLKFTAQSSEREFMTFIKVLYFTLKGTFKHEPHLNYELGNFL